MIITPPPTPRGDPLSSYTPESTTTATPTTTVVVDPLATVEPASIPSWLQIPKSEAPVETPEIKIEVPVSVESPIVEAPV